jgi:hypothetical protein
MPSCDTCGLLRDLPDENARHYKACSWQAKITMPEPVLHLERIAIIERHWSKAPARWVTRKVLEKTPEMLPECSCWIPRE